MDQNTLSIIMNANSAGCNATVFFSRLDVGEPTSTPAFHTLCNHRQHQAQQITRQALFPCEHYQQPERGTLRWECGPADKMPLLLSMF